MGGIVLDKPITVLREEYLRAVVDLSNSVRSLPAFIKQQVLQQCADEYSRIARVEYENDMRAYTQSMNHEEEGTP